MEFKILIYIIGAVIYFVYKQFQKLQREAVKRQAQLTGEMKPFIQPVAVEIQKPLQRVKSERQELDTESARVRAQNKMRSSKTPKPFFEKPEHVISVFTDPKYNTPGSTGIAVSSPLSENILPEEIDIRKMILYSELLRHPAW
ncbi:MAG: hypothetical protein ABI723_24825 [Bacteroidia bacterium]